MMLLWVVLALTAWCVLPLPLAMAVGRAFRAGSHPDRADRDAYVLAC